MDINERRNLLITCSPGIENYLAGELKTLGFEITSQHPGGIITKGSFVETIKLNLCLRTAYAVLYLLKEFRCGTPDSLYKHVNKIPWEKIISPDEYFTVLSRVNTYSINNSMFPSLKVKDAIVDRIQNKTSKRPDSGPDRNAVVINLFWKNDRAWIYLNSSGVKLSDRNYRKMPHKAPLRESLAAAIIMATGYDGSQNLVLPMCGSGTLAIEAVLLATHKPAAILRSNFGFKHIKDYDEKVWQKIRNDTIKTVQKPSPKKQIIATDIDPVAIEAARQNAKTAGVEHLIQFDVCDFADSKIPDEPGIIILNPEYGLRLGDIEKLENTYKRIGDFFKQKCAGYTSYIFTGNKELAKKVGLKSSAKIPFYNGNIECRLLKYQIYQGSKK